MEYLDNIGKRAQTAKPDLQHLKSEEKYPPWRLVKKETNMI